MTKTVLPTSNSTNINYSSTFPDHVTNPSAAPSTLLVVGISTPLLILALAVLIITIVAIIWTKRRKSTKSIHNLDAEQLAAPRSTLTRPEHPDITLNHPMDALYAVVDVGSQGEDGKRVQNEPNVENLPNSEEKKGQVALEDLYAVVNKRQKKKQNENTSPAQSNTATVERVYSNIKKLKQAAEEEEIAPQIPPHTVEKLYTAVVKKSNDSVHPTEETLP